MPTPYTGNSIIDYLSSVGKASDFASRAALAAQNGITNYSGTGQQNTQLLGILNRPSSVNNSTSNYTSATTGQPAYSPAPTATPIPTYNGNFVTATNSPTTITPPAPLPPNVATVATAQEGDYVPGKGIKQVDGTYSPTSAEQNARTFGRIGNQVYETTGGKFDYITPEYYKSNLAGKIDLNTVGQISKSSLNEAQTGIANRIATEQTGSPAFTTTTGAATGPLSGSEFNSQTVVDTSKMTESQFNEHVTNLTGGPSSNTYTPPQVSNGNNAYYRTYNTTTKEWDVFRASDGAAVTSGNTDPELDWDKLGLNVTHLNTPSALQQFGGTTVKTPTTPVDSETAIAIKKLEDSIAALKDPFAGQTIAGVRTTLNTELGLDTMYQESIDNKSKINDITNGYEKIGSEITDNVNLPQGVKTKRLTFLNSKQQLALNALVRNQELIDQRITRAEKTVTDRLSDTVNQYNIYRNQVNDIQTRVDKLQAREDKVSENAQQTFQFLASNPELMKDATQSEFDFIQKYGRLPQTMITRIGQNAGEKYLSIVQGQTTTGTKTVFGVTKNGLVPLGTFADVSQSTGTNTSQITVDLPDGQYRVTYDQMGNELNRNRIGDSTKTKTVQQTRADFINWLPTVAQTYTNDQLENVLSMFMPGYSSDKDTAMKSAIDTYKYNAPGTISNNTKPNVTDPITAFGTYSGTGNSNAPADTYTLNGVTYTKGTDGLFYPQQ